MNEQAHIAAAAAVAAQLQAQQSLAATPAAPILAAVSGPSQRRLQCALRTLAPCSRPRAIPEAR